MGTLKLRGLSLEGGCDRTAFPQNLPGILLESKQHPPPSIPYSEQMCDFCAVLGISSAQRGHGEEWRCADRSGGAHGLLWWPETMAVLLRWAAPTQGPHLVAPESQESVKDSPGLLTPGHMPE